MSTIKEIIDPYLRKAGYNFIDPAYKALEGRKELTPTRSTFSRATGRHLGDEAFLIDMEKKEQTITYKMVQISRQIYRELLEGPFPNRFEHTNAEFVPLYRIYRLDQSEVNMPWTEGKAVCGEVFSEKSKDQAGIAVPRITPGGESLLFIPRYKIAGRHFYGVYIDGVEPDTFVPTANSKFYLRENQIRNTAHLRRRNN